MVAERGRRSGSACVLFMFNSNIRLSAAFLAPNPTIIAPPWRVRELGPRAGHGEFTGRGVARNWHSVHQRSAHRTSMIQDFFDTKARSQLVSRTYASDPLLFRDIDTLDKCSSWTDPVIFSDQMALSPTTRGAIFSTAIRSLLVVAAFLCFPTLVEDISPLIFLKDGALSDEVRLGLTGSFLPGVSLLFGALFSYTISLLVNRQIKIEEIVNAEVSALLAIVLHMEDYFRYSPTALEAAMEAGWRHTDTLIFQSRYQEILLLVQDDPLEDIMRVRVRVRDGRLVDDTSL
ncbi:unnamed protein product [Ectocarpus fasciculatus]